MAVTPPPLSDTGPLPRIETRRTTRRITRWVLMRALWRSFFFQATANYERMQNVGFAYCMMPALERLYEGEALAKAMARHLEFFNSHPYMADALLGATIKLEEDVAAGRATPEQVQLFKRCMMGPMAAIGDSFFWASLKPFGTAWAIAGVLSGVLWAPLAFLALYNLFHLFARAYGLFVGYGSGENVVEQVHRLDMVRFADRCHYLAGVFLGIGGALLVGQAQAGALQLGRGLEPVLMVALTLIFLLSLRRKIRVPTLLYGGAAGVFFLIVGLNALYPLF